MRTTMIIACLAIATIASSQNKGALMFDVALDFPDGTTGVGASASVGTRIKDAGLVGMGVGVMKFQNDKKINVPVFATFALMPSFNNSKGRLMIIVQPGYNAYSTTYRIANRDYETTGGFYIHTGVGFAFAQRKAPFINVGYSRYGYTFNGPSENTTGAADCFALRFGFLL